MEKLIVSNFLNIKHIELELGKINILIGPQAQGKSVIAKLVYFFQSFWQDFSNFLYPEDNQEDFEKILRDKFEDIFPKYTWLEQNFKITYLFEQYQVTLFLNSKNYEQRYLKINYPIFQDIFNDFKAYQEIANKETDEYIDDWLNKNLEKLFQETLEELSIESKTKLDINKSLLIKIKEKLNEDMDIRQFKRSSIEKHIIKKYFSNFENKINQEIFFIPSGRSFFSFLKENIFNLTDSFQFEYFMKAFGSIYNRTATKYEYQNRHQKDKYDPMIDILTERILKGKYSYEQDIDLIASQDGRKTRLIDASSGQQEALPIIVLLTVFGLSENICNFIIEEPEAHLFPAAQNDIVNLMSLIFNLTEKKHSFFLTTHSPYILTTFNTLIQAGNTRKKIITENREHQLPELYKIIPENQILDIDDVKVYSLQNGEIEDIINYDNQLIDANIIDEISNKTGDQFDKLLDLEFNNE